MAVLAEDRKGDGLAGMEALAERARDEREGSLEHLVDVADSVLPPEQLHLFQRSIEPMLRDELTPGPGPPAHPPGERGMAWPGAHRAERPLS